MKILYIPADNISANFSRSYHIGKSLSAHCDLYKVMWVDNRTAFWNGKKATAYNGAICFFKSLFQKNKIVKSNDYGYEVYASVFISAFIGRIVGKYNSLKWMRKHNLKTLNNLVAQIKPDLIFHADGYYFFPAYNSNIPEFSDLQDDISWSNIPDKKLKAARNYYTNQFKVSTLNFIVSESAKLSICKYIKADFIPISNGADFTAISTISLQEKKQFKKKFNIPEDKKIVSYVGGAHKFDVDFTRKLAQQASMDAPNLLFVLAGNLPQFESTNVVFTGIIPNREADVLYALSDVGVTLKNTANNEFIYHSVPLKFVQYAAAKKPIVSFPIKWSVENKFPNIIHLHHENEEVWISEIKNCIAAFYWKEEYDLLWEKYDWKNIGNTLYKKMKSSL